MFLTIENATDKDTVLFEKITYWAVDMLDFPENTDDLDITITFLNLLNTKHRAYGFAGVGDVDDGNTWTIEIDSDIDMLTKVSTLFHELVHVKQYFKKEMKDTHGGNKVRWKGKYFSSTTKKFYIDMPWEIEAYGYERLLLKYWLKDFEKYEPKLIRKLRREAKTKLL